ERALRGPQPPRDAAVAAREIDRVLPGVILIGGDLAADAGQRELRVQRQLAAVDLDARRRSGVLLDLDRRDVRLGRGGGRRGDRAPTVEVDVDPIDVHERRVAVERAADLDVAQDRVAERDVDRAEPDLARDLLAEPLAGAADLPRRDLRKYQPEHDREQEHEA